MMTKHASERKQQRGFHDIEMDLILTHGKQEYASRGAVISTITKGQVKSIRKAIDRLRGGETVVVGPNGKILTVYRKN